MKGLPALIRLHRWQLDSHRRELAELDRLRHGLLQEVSDLEREIRAEQAVAASSEGLQASYGAYATQAVQRRQVIGKSLAEVEMRIDRTKGELHEIYGQVKSYELALEHAERRRRAEAARREQGRLDEIALQQHGRSGQDAA